MMTVLVMAIVLSVCALAQLLCPPLALLGQAKPPLLLAAVLYYALNRETGPLLLCALLAGLAHDLLGGVPPGWSVALYGLAGLAVGRFRTLVLTESAATAAFFGALGGAVLTAVTWLLLARAGRAVWPVGRVAVKALCAGLLGGLVAPLVFVVTRRLDQWVGNVRVREVVDGIEQPLGF